VKVGVFDHMDQSGLPAGRHYEDRLRLVEAYDAAGIYAYHVAEHHATPLGSSPSPGIFLSAVAQRTKHLKFGPLVYPLPLYHPLRLVEEISMLDQLSGGRYQVGLGKGASPFETSYYGTNPEEVGAIFEESLSVLRQGLSGQPINHTGTHYRFDDVDLGLKPLQVPHPPFWYGVTAPQGAVWTARAGINIVCNLPAERIRPITDRYRQEWAANGGAPDAIPLMGMNRYLSIAQTEAEAMARGRRAYRLWHDHFWYLWRKHDAVPAFTTYPENFDEAVRQGYALAGTPEQVARALNAQLDVSGSNYLIVRFAFGDLSLAESLETLDLFARHILPGVARRNDNAASRLFEPADA